MKICTKRLVIKDYEKFLKDFLITTMTELDVIDKGEIDSVAKNAVEHMDEFISWYKENNIEVNPKITVRTNKIPELSVVLTTTLDEINNSYFAKLTGSVSPEEYARFMTTMLLVEAVIYTSTMGAFSQHYPSDSDLEKSEANDTELVKKLRESIRREWVVGMTYKWIPIIWDYFINPDTELWMKTTATIID